MEPVDRDSARIEELSVEVRRHRARSARRPSSKAYLGAGLTLIGLALGGAVVAGLVFGGAVAETPAPKATATAPATAGPTAPAIAVASPAELPSDPPSSEPTESPTAAPTDQPSDNGNTEPTPTKAPPAPTGNLPSVGPAPAGIWTGIQWIPVPTGHAPAITLAPVDSGVSYAALASWSKGFVEFVWNPGKFTVVPWASADGLTWTAGSALGVAGWPSQLKSNDISAGDRSECNFNVDSLQEGPGNMILTGSLTCSLGCGSPFVTSQKQWLSSDGMSWTPLDLSAVTHVGTIGPISGGSSGYVGLGSANKKPALWLSGDGVDWRQGTLPADGLDATASIADPVSFAGGYVLPGSVLDRSGKTFDLGPGGGCAYTLGDVPSGLLKRRAALWWSPDGSTWTRASLPGTTAAYTVTMTVARVDDKTLIATQSAWNPDGDVATATWASTDGLVWKQLKSDPGFVVTSGARGLFRSSWSLPTSFSTFDSGLNLVSLQQTGAQPPATAGELVLGPTGLLVTENGSRFWLGVPTVG
jgi:hypothetical protein